VKCRERGHDKPFLARGCLIKQKRKIRWYVGESATDPSEGRQEYETSPKRRKKEPKNELEKNARAGGTVRKRPSHCRKIRKQFQDRRKKPKKVVYTPCKANCGGGWKSAYRQNRGLGDQGNSKKPSNSFAKTGLRP